MNGINNQHPFRILEIDIVDDQQVVDDAFDNIKKKYKHFENSTNPRERLQYKTIFQAYKELKDPTKRKQIIDGYKQKLRKDIDVFISGKTVIEQRAVDDLINNEKELWGFSSQLALLEITEVLEERGIEIGKKIVHTPKSITDFAISPGRDSLLLTWTLPPDNCDEVLIVRRDDRYPGLATDGTVAYRDQGHEFRDTGVKPGECYYYAAFTLFEDSVSRQPVQQKECIPAPVSDVTVKSRCHDVELHWTVPPSAEYSVVVRRQDAPPVFTVSGGTVDVTEGRKIYEGGNTTFKDTGLKPGVGYYYALLAVFPGGSHTNAVTELARTLELPATPAALHLQESPGGVFCRWPGGADTEGYILLRKEGAPPGNIDDGIEISRGTAPEYEDTDLINGVLYYYGVFAFNGDYVSPTAATGKFILKKPVREAKAVAGNQRIDLSWSLPPGADDVLVRRSDNLLPHSISDGEHVPHTTKKTLTDTSVKNGATYHYGIFVVYNTVSGVAYSRGELLRNLTPVGPPKPVEDVRATYQDGEVCVRWTRPSEPGANVSIGDVCITYSDAPLDFEKGDIVDFSLVGDKVRGWAQMPASFRDNGPREGRIGYYGVFAVSRMSKERRLEDFPMTYSGGEAVNLLRDVERVKGRREPDRSIRITWDWPVGCELVYVARAIGTMPYRIIKDANWPIAVDITDREIEDGFVRIYRKQEYLGKKAFIDDAEDIRNQSPVCFLICTGGGVEENMVFSNGITIEIS
ncbi:MAG: fibronectin type III domain-containing protein [bacterium]|nr:fibronectin type III domain-containing protein [bacterium]